MKLISSKIASAVVVVTLGVTTTGCHIYKKFELPEDRSEEHTSELQSPR